MKVLYLNPLGELGGAERSLLNLLAGLREIDSPVEPHVVTAGAGPFVEALAERGVPCEVLPFPAGFGAVGDAGAGRKRLLQLGQGLRIAPDLLGYVQQLRHSLERLSPDVVHTNGFKMHLVGAWAASKPRYAKCLIGHIHDYVSSRPLAGKALGMSRRRFDSFIANSRSVAADVGRSLRGSRVATVYNAVSADFRPEGARMDLDALAGLPPADQPVLRIGLVATYARWKGQLAYLRALARLPRDGAWRAYLVGAPIYRRASAQFSHEELQGEIEQLGLSGRVGFTGFVRQTADAMRSLDIVVHASTAPEPFGMTIIEAMACGKPVVVSRLGGANELFEEGVTALGHMAGDDRDLASQLLRLLTDPALRARLGEQSRLAVGRRFTTEIMAREVTAVYQASLHGRFAHEEHPGLWEPQPSSLPNRPVA